MSQIDRSDKKSLNNLTKWLDKLKKEPKLDKNLNGHNDNKNKTPTTKITSRGKLKNIPKLDEWLVKKGVLPSSDVKTIKNRLRPRTFSESLPNCNESSIKTNGCKFSSKTKKTTINKENLSKRSTLLTKLPNKKSHVKDKTIRSGSHVEQSTLKSFIKTNRRKMLQRNDSSDSIDLPIFDKIKKKGIKRSSKSKEQKILFKKYGVILPTVDEILKDKKDLEQSKIKMKTYKPISEDSLELPSEEEVMYNLGIENCLDCKHLNFEQLENYFQKNIPLLSGISCGKIKNDRHQRYFDTNYKTLFSTNLMCNTSTVVFNYDQIDFLMNSLNKQFDVDDTRTEYLFQVLLPELCLRIFMEAHEMNSEDAIKYLDHRPILD